ncbi:hypothetical protein M9458_039800, partial [Cirrhinus mrigala]
MDVAARFTTLAYKDLTLLKYAVEFSQLTVLMVLALPAVLPDTTGLNWREAIIRCLESIRPPSRTTPDPEASPPSPCCTEPKPKPTVDGEPMPASINGPSPRRATELEIVPEPESLGASDQVCEPATALATREITVDSESTEGVSTHGTMAEGELSSVDFVYTVLPPSSSIFPELSVCPVSTKEAIYELSICPEPSACMTMTTQVFLKSLALQVLRVALWCVWAAHTFSNSPYHSELLLSLPLPPPLHQSSPLPPLSLGSSSAYPQPTICVVGSSHALPVSTDIVAGGWPVDPAAPWLLAPSSPPWPVSPPAPLGSLVPSASPWSVVDYLAPRYSTSLAAPRPSIPPALSGSSFPLVPPRSSVAPAPPQPSLLWPSRSSASPWLFVSLSPPWAPPPPALPAPWSRQPFLHLDSSLHRLHRG